MQRRAFPSRPNFGCPFTSSQAPGPAGCRRSSLLSRGCASLIGSVSRGYFWSWRHSKRASAFATSGGGGGGRSPSREAQRGHSLAVRVAPPQPGATHPRRPAAVPHPPALYHLSSKKRKMSESSSKSSQPLASKQEKDGSEKRGRGRPRKQPAKEPSEAPTPKRPRGRPKGSKNKGAAKGRKTTTAPGRKPRGRPKKLEKEEEEGISQESSEEEQ